MKYRAFSTSQGKVIQPHRFSGDQMRIIDRQIKSRGGLLTYGITMAGNHVRLSPQRPWSGKSERRKVIRNRRNDRAMDIIVKWRQKARLEREQKMNPAI